MSVIIIHHLEHAHAAAQAAQKLGVDLVMQNPPGSYAYTGLGYFQVILKQTKLTFPHINIDMILDIGTDASLIYPALERGFTTLLFRGNHTIHEKLSNIASKHNATILVEEAPHIVDLYTEENAYEAALACLQQWHKKGEAA